MDALAFMSVAADATLISFVLGTVAARSSADYRARVANRSTVYLAGQVSVWVDGEDADQFLLSPDGLYFARTLTVGDLPASAVSSPFYLRRITPAAASGACLATLRAAAQTWTQP